MTASLIGKPNQTSGNFSQGGNGKYKPLRTRKQGSGASAAEFDPFNPTYDRMHFKNTRDAVYIAFDYVENQPFSKLTSDFIKENITAPINQFLSSLFQ